jgi:aspartate 1-decarboxylase
MQVTLLKSKIHRAVVTGSDLNYEGSIFIDKTILKQANILDYEKVEIYNINNGARFSTYAVPVETKGSFSVNGAAARMVQKGDLIIICTYASMDKETASKFQPTVVIPK